MPRKTNFTVNGRKYYRVTAKVGINSNGTPIRKQFLGLGKREAEAKKAEYLEYINKGLAVGFDKLTFGAAFNEWFEVVHSRKLKLSSKMRYETDIRLRILPSTLVTKKLVEIKSIDIQHFYNTLTDIGTSANSVRNAHKLLSAFFTYCEDKDIIIKSPLRKNLIVLPECRDIKTEKKYLSNTDISKIIDYTNTNLDTFIFLFMIFSGLRIGEVLALEHKDVDIVDKIITVNKTVTHLTINGSYQPIVSTTKTKGSTREVPLFKKILPLLKLHINSEQEKHKKLGIKSTENKILFSSSVGSYIEKRNLRRKWERMCRCLNIEKTTVHALRHTFCTMLAEQGVNLKTTSELMGHSDTKTTQRIYVHVKKDEKIRAIATLSSVYN